jgi:hypothetical protein
MMHPDKDQLPAIKRGTFFALFLVIEVILGWFVWTRLRQGIRLARFR